MLVSLSALPAGQPVSLVALPHVALDRIADQLPHRDKLGMRLVSRLFRELIPPCVTLEVKQLSTTIHVRSVFTEGPLTEAFMADHEHSLSASRDAHKHRGMVNCVRNFAFPPTSNYSFFSSAKIDHLLIDAHFPLILNSDNLVHFSNLLRGCTIDEISLVFENATAGSLTKIGPLIAKVRAATLDLKLVRMDYRAEDWNDAFAHGLVAAGVQGVSFSGKPIERVGWNNNPGPNEYISSFDIFLKLFSAGIKRVTVNPEALIEGDLSDIAFGALFEKLAGLGRRLRLDLHMSLRFSCPKLYEEESDLIRKAKMIGVFIKISKSTKRMRNQRRYYGETGDCISIECDGIRA